MLQHCQQLGSCIGCFDDPVIPRCVRSSLPPFRAEGWPIGSGMVESANKLVVEDRPKGAGMHWADVNVNPLLALRNAVANNRWEAC